MVNVLIGGPKVDLMVKYLAKRDISLALESLDSDILNHTEKIDKLIIVDAKTDIVTTSNTIKSLVKNNKLSINEVHYIGHSKVPKHHVIKWTLGWLRARTYYEVHEFDDLHISKVHEVIKQILK